MAAMVASQVMRLSMAVRASEEAVWAARSRAYGIAGEAAAAVLALVLVVDLVEDGDERAGLELFGDGGDFAEAAGFAEGAEEALALEVGLAEAAPLGEHDGPGDDAGEEQENEHGEGHRAAVVNHLREGARVGCRGWRGGVVLKEMQSESESPDHSYFVHLGFSVNGERVGCRYEHQPWCVS